MLLEASTCERLHYFRRSYVPARQHDRSRSPCARVVRIIKIGWSVYLLHRALFFRPRAAAARVQPMSAGEDASEPRPQPAGEPAAFTRLLPAGETADASQIVDGFELGKRAQTVAARPYLILNMVSTLDGRASIGGRSGPIGNRAGRELVHALRAGVDAVMAGAGTVRVERYGRIIPNVATRERRVERGLEQEPLACIVS